MSEESALSLMVVTYTYPMLCLDAILSGCAILNCSSCDGVLWCYEAVAVVITHGSVIVLKCYTIT